MPIPPDGIVIVPVTLPPLTPTPWDVPLQAFVENRLSNLCVIPVR